MDVDVPKWFLLAKYFGKVQNAWNHSKHRTEFDQNDILEIDYLFLSLDKMAGNVTHPIFPVIQGFANNLALIQQKIKAAEIKAVAR